jgi:hypothetical protein
MEGRGWLSSVIGTRSRTVGQSQKRNNRKIFDIISELRPKCSSAKMKKNEDEKKMKRKTSCRLKLPNYISLYKLENP